MQSIKANTVLIQAALGISHEAYTHLVHEHGIEYLRRFFGSDELVVNAFAKSRLFWLWWKQQWELRDARFVYLASLKRQELPFTGQTKLAAIDAYYLHNDLSSLKVTPNRWARVEMNTMLENEIKQLENTI